MSTTLPARAQRRQVPALQAPSTPPWPSRRAALLAGSALGLAGIGAWRVHDAAGWQQVWADHATTRGERRQITLPDGSRLHLNTDSAVNVHYDAHAPILLLAGEIYLTSAADAQGRGLWVETPDGRAQARGTRYRVWRENDATGIAVDDGVVALWPALANPAQPTALLAAGQQAHMTRRQARDVGATSHAQRDDRAWIDGRLAVNGLPLAEFLDELARYHGTIEHGPDIAPLRVTGEFTLADTKGILASLCQALPVQVGRQRSWWGDTVTWVRKRHDTDVA